METIDWPQTGERVEGLYLGVAFAGVVTAVAYDKPALGRRYTVKFDAPLNVSKSALMTIMRQTVRALVADNGTSVDDKGRPDGIMTLSKA
jgi:glyoxalase superfamily protein